MAKNKFDPNSAFKKITGIDEAEKSAEVVPVAKTGTGSSPFPPQPEQAPKSPGERAGFVGAYYRISPKHVKAIKIREAFSDDPKDKDKSAIVRAALDLYLRDELKNL